MMPEFLKKAAPGKNLPLMGLISAFHHLNEGLLPMPQIDLSPGQTKTVHITGLNAEGAEVALTSPVVATSDSPAVTVATRADLTNAFDVTGASVGSANIGIVSGSLSLSLPVTVADTVAVALSATVDEAQDSLPPVIEPAPDAPADDTPAA